VIDVQKVIVAARRVPPYGLAAPVAGGRFRTDLVVEDGAVYIHLAAYVR
jgi:hypothetical protein